MTGASVSAQPLAAYWVRVPALSQHAYSGAGLERQKGLTIRAAALMRVFGFFLLVQKETAAPEARRADKVPLGCHA